MRYFKVVFVLVAIFSFGFGTMNAEEVKDSKLKLTVLDSIRREPVEFATASITPLGASNPSKYALSDSRGKVELAGLAAGKYTIRIEYMGYITYSKPITIEQQRVVDLGDIALKEQMNTLNSVVVTAVGNPIVVKKDTIEYNASSYKTTDNDMLEELLKKLPGVEIDSDGKITANGKEINKIMIDGKTFFLNDPQLATKNIPAKIVDKVKVVEKKSEQAQFTGINDGNEETVIDLSIRPGMMNGWFGNLSAGYGTDDRYQAAGMAGNFKQKSQITFIGNLNNTNNRGFSDIAGAMMSAMRSSSGMGGVRIGGATMRFGGNGITKSWLGGINGNLESANKKLKLGGNYLYSGSDNLATSKSLRQNFLTDSTFNYSQSTKSENYSDGHRMALQLEYQLTDKASILFRPNVSIGKGNFNDTKDFWTRGGLGTKINEGNSESFGENSSQSVDGDLLFRQKLNKVGRTFSVNVNYSFSNNDIFNAKNLSKTIIGDKADSTVINQEYKMNTLGYTLGARASYTEPLGKNFFMELAYQYRYRLNKSDKEAYNYNSLTNSYNLKDSVYSNSFENTFINQTVEANLRKTGEKYNYVVGFNVQPSTTRSIGSNRDLSRSVVNFAPMAMFEYEFSDTRDLELRYRGNTRQPSINQLQPVPDNSNPLYIPLGNPDLLPEFEHSLRIEYSDTKKEKFRTVNAGLNATYTMDKIVNKRWYDPSGVQYTMPVNEQGAYNVNANFMYNTPIAKSKISIMNFTRAGVNKGVSFSGRTEANLVKNYTTSLSINDMLRLMYRGNKLQLSIGGRVGYNYAWYTVQQTKKPATWNNSVSGYINWTLPAGINLTSDADYNFYIGYGEGYNTPAIVWNAEISKLMFKNTGTLRLKVFDILNQSKSVWRTTTDNYIEDVQNNILQQYFMLSFTWRFGTFGGNRGGRDGHGGDHGPGPGRGPGMGGMGFH
jgi:hypothetical protein